ncbi:MAG: beta-L-arabinofuranosidase domain-containing protein [Gemmatimonadota bacterium]
MDRRSFLRTTAAAGFALPIASDAFGMDILGVRARIDAGAAGDYAVRAVPLSKVRITDGFWRPRMDANRNVSLDHCLARFDDGGAFSVSKLVEAVAYMVTERPDATLEARADERITQLVASIDQRLEDPAQAVRISGHVLEAGVAYHEATGKRALLDAVLRAADAMDRVYGPGRATYISGHEGLKMGLIELYRATGEQKYWRLAKFFADERGRDDYERTGEYARDRTYAQDHARVVDQDEAVGHAVRATFLYIPMTDIAVLDGSEPYRSAADRIWDDATGRKTYVTGGIGSVRFHEKFGAAYELPNLSAWNETCAAYGNVVWNHRMFMLHRDARYIDVMERVLYNALLVGVSLRGDRFFYQNPLVSYGDYERFEWINVPCCPPNVVRMIASVGEYVYAEGAADDGVYVNLFVDSSAELMAAGAPVTIRQETRYPWDGDVRIHVEPQTPTTFALHVRIPGWTAASVLPGDLYGFVDEAAEPPRLSINGEPQPLRVERGYCRLARTWNPGDVVDLLLPMPVRQVEAHENVADDAGRVALQRGPLVYCAEWPDNDGRALNIVVPQGAALRSEFDADLLEGVQVIRGTVQAITRTASAGVAATVPHELTAIPYFAWANRGMGEMAVWLAREPAIAWLPPVLPPNVARVTTSGGVVKAWTGYNDQNDDLAAVYDGREPLNSADQSHRFFRMRPPVGETAWIRYDFVEPAEIASTRVYWFDDKRFCRMPVWWRISYRRGNEWLPVQERDPYTVVKDGFSSIRFAPVRADAVRIEIEPETVPYASGQIGPPAAMFIAEDIDWRECGVIEWQVT